MAANNWYALFAKRTARATGRSFVFALEELEQENLQVFKKKFQLLAQDARRQLIEGGLDTGTPEA